MGNMLISWMAGVAGYSAGAAGNLTSGGSLANLLAVVASAGTTNTGSVDPPPEIATEDSGRRPYLHQLHPHWR